MTSNSFKSQDSFQSCYSSLFESSQELESDLIQDSLNDKVFLIPSSINDLWLLEQINQLKILNSKIADSEYFQDEERDYQVNDKYFDNLISNEKKVSNASPKLSDIIKEKLTSNKHNVFEEDTLIINELIRELSLHDLSSCESENGDMLLTQDEIDGIKEILSQE